MRRIVLLLLIIILGAFFCSSNKSSNKIIEETDVTNVTEVESKDFEESKIETLKVTKPKSFKYTEEDVTYLALNVFFETRMLSLDDAISTSHVVMNRVKSEKYPDTIKGVITQRKQFSWFGNKTLKEELKNPLEQNAWMKSLEFAENFLKFYTRLNDTTNGSLFYHAHYVNPSWSRKMLVTLITEQHIFLKCERC